MLNSSQWTFSISNFRLWKVSEWIPHPKICRSTSKNHLQQRIFENFPSCGLLAMFVKPNLHPVFMVPFHLQKWLLQVVITCAHRPEDPGLNLIHRTMCRQPLDVLFGLIRLHRWEKRWVLGWKSRILPILTTFWFVSPLLEGVSPPEFFYLTRLCNANQVKIRGRAESK